MNDGASWAYFAQNAAFARCSFIGFQQRLMGREGLQIAIDRTETIERRFPAQRRAGGFDRVGAVHTDEGVQVLQRLTLFFRLSSSRVCRQR